MKAKPTAKKKKSKGNSRVNKDKSHIRNPTKSFAHDKPVVVPNRRAAEKDLSRSADLIAALSRVAAQMGTLIDPDQVLKSMGDGLKQAGIDSIFFLMKPDAKSLIVNYVSIDQRLIAMGEKAAGVKLIGYSLPIGADFPKYLNDVIERKESLFVPNLKDLADTLFSGSKLTRAKRGLQAAGINLGTPLRLLPLISNELVIGVLAVWSESLQEKDLEILSVFAGLVTAAFVNTRLIGEVQRELIERKRAEDERILLDKVRIAVAKELDLSTTLHTVVESVAEIFGYSHVSLYLLQGDSLILQHQVGYPQVINEIPVTQGVSGRVAQSGQPAFIKDAQNDPAFLNAIDGLTSEICVPIFDEGRVAGTLNIESVQTEGPTDSDLNLMIALSESISPAIGRARLYTELRQSEERFAALVNAPFEGIVISDKGHVIDCNEQMAEMLGYESSEIIGSDVSQFVAPESLETVRNQLKAGSNEPYEHLAIRKDGTIFPVETRARSIPYKGRQARISVIRDIIDQKQAEETLRQSEKEYRTLFENVPDGIYRTTPDGRILSANPALAKMFGYETEEEFKQAGADDLYLNPGDREHSMRMLEEDGEIFNFEVSLKRRDGTSLILLENARAIKDEEGRVQYYEGVLTDITKRKHAELELQHRREDLELINTLNAVINRGESLDILIDTLHREAKRIYSALYCTISLLSPDGKILTIQRLTVPSVIIKKIEQLIGLSISKIHVPIKDGGQIQNILRNEKGTITTDPNVIQRWMTEYTESTFLSPAMRRMTKKLIPQIHRMLNIGSTLAIPLISNGRTMGLLELASTGSFTEETLIRVRNVTEQITAAILRKQTEEAERDQRTLAEALRDTAETLNRSLDFRSVLDQILNIVGRVVPHDAATVMLIDNGKLHLGRSQGYEERGLSPEKILNELSLHGTANLKQIYESRQPVLIPDVSEYPHWKNYPGMEWLRSNVGAPMIIHDSVIGFLLLDSEAPGFFTPLHAQRLQAFANQAAIAVQNARLYEAAQVEIKERRQAEDALTQFRNIMDSSNDAIYMIDVETGRYLDFNISACETLGYTREELLQITIMDVAQHIPNIKVWRERVNLVFENDRLLFESIYLRKDGSSIPVEVSAKTLRMEDNPILLATVRDISERKAAQKEISRQLEELTALHRVALAGIQAQNVDELIERITQIIGDTFFPDHFGVILLDQPENVLRPHSSYRGLSATNTAKTFPLTLGVAGRVISSGLPQRIGDIRLDPDYFQATSESLSELCVPIHLGGHVIGVINAESRQLDFFNEADERLLVTIAGQAAIAIDNSNLLKRLKLSNTELEKRVEERTEELNQINLELRHANRTKDEFLANMSHELRTPLNSILGFSETLLEQRRGPINEKQEQYVSLIHSSGQHLLGLINDILDVSKIEAGKLDLHPDTIHVKEICESSLNFVKEMAAKKSIRVDFMNETFITTLRADPQRLKQILVNLLSNAVKFTPEKGKVSLEVSVNDEKDQIQFSVTDNGIGIAHENLSKLFIPFSQIDSSLSRQYEGTGLGLALVMKLTELHGGSVNVESEPGRGSRFTINLPWSEYKKMTKKGGTDSLAQIDFVEQPQSINGEPVKILLAEDNLSNVLTIQEYLSDHGYEVIVAHNGAEAITLAEESSPNIILMDIQMPEMDGLEAIRRIRAKPQFTSVPIIALTALAMPGDRERCLEAGANEYLSKPVSLKGLVKTIGELLP